MTKLTIPPEFKLGCRTYKIRISEKILHETHCRAQVVDGEELIRLSQSQPFAMLESLMHELLHSIFFICGIDEDNDLDDKKITPMACLLAQALLTLGIEPDFSKIPDEEN